MLETRIVMRMILGATMASGCATVSVKTDFDPTVDFSQYRSFELIGGELLVNGRSDDTNTLVKDRIRDAITTELVSKGFQAVESGGDLMVAYVAGARTVTEVEAIGPYRPGFGPYWSPRGWWWPAYYDWWTRTYTKGTLVIDLMDAGTKKLVWRAYAGADVTAPDAKDLIAKAVHKAFAKFPPKRSGEKMERVSKK
jgi:hypothetical protein